MRFDMWPLYDWTCPLPITQLSECIAIPTQAEWNLYPVELTDRWMDICHGGTESPTFRVGQHVAAGAQAGRSEARNGRGEPEVVPRQGQPGRGRHSRSGPRRSR